MVAKIARIVSFSFIILSLGFDPFYSADQLLPEALVDLLISVTLHC